MELLHTILQIITVIALIGVTAAFIIVCWFVAAVLLSDTFYG